MFAVKDQFLGFYVGTFIGLAFFEESVGAKGMLPEEFTAREEAEELVSKLNQHGLETCKVVER